MRRALVCLCLLAAWAQARTFHVIVAGLGGEADYDTRFTTLTKELDQLVSSPDSQVTLLQGNEATRSAVQQAVQKAVREAGAADAIIVAFIGHGTWDGTDYKFNVKGSDVSAADLRAWLDPSQAKQLVLLATSCSGAAIPALRAANRVVVTATRTGTEKNAVVFSRYWVEAMRDAAADADKNESVSALEAFRYADLKTTKFYETEKRLATEHPLLEDSGIGEGVRAPSPQNGEGLLASQVAVARFGSAQKAMADPAKQALLRKREELEQAVDRLKYEKAAMPLEEYRKKLTALLLELATVQQEIDK
jgi:hypothetical protein